MEMQKARRFIATGLGITWFAILLPANQGARHRQLGGAHSGICGGFCLHLLIVVRLLEAIGGSVKSGDPDELVAVGRDM